MEARILGVIQSWDKVINTKFERGRVTRYFHSSEYHQRIENASSMLWKILGESAVVSTKCNNIWDNLKAELSMPDKNYVVKHETEEQPFKSP